MDWRDEAECKNVDPELFFPTSLKGPGRAQADQAKAVCRTCPVIADCLQWALESTPVPDGIWGGTDEDERANMVRRGDGKPSKRRYFRKEWR